MISTTAAHCDILIIGAGAAGLAAAIEAARIGAKVLIVEQAPTWGGTAIIAGGGCCMVDTPLQQKLGIQDSIQLASEDWYRWSEGTADMRWARYYIEKSASELYSWAEKLGVEWEAVMLHEGNSVPRWHRAKGLGRQIVTSMFKEVQRLGVQCVFSAAARQLVLSREGEGSRVIGATFALNGEQKTLFSKITMVATGGFCSNKAMVESYSPRVRGRRFLVAGGRGARGEGHQLVQDCGGALTCMEDIWFYAYGTPDPEDKLGERGIVIRGLNNSVWVNAQGLRFHNELLKGGATATPALLEQHPSFAWAIMDSAILEELNIGQPGYRKALDGNEAEEKTAKLLTPSEHVKTSDSMAELATLAGLDPTTLVATIDHYNSYIQGGLKEDPEFGKALTGLRTLSRPPFYAIQLFPTARKNLGGVATDLSCRVLDQKGAWIPGLYAAGEVAGMAGGHINGKAALEGTMLGPSIFSGRVAGACAAQELGLKNPAPILATF